MENITVNNSDSNNNEGYIFDKIHFYTLIAILPIGTVGNFVSILIFSRPCFNSRTNTGRLYALLCAFNLITIIFVAAFKKLDILSAFKIQLPFNSEFFIEDTLLQLLSWTQVLITFDRFIGVFYPINGVRFMRRKSVLLSMFFAILFSLLCVNSPFFIRHTETFTIDNRTFSLYYIMSSEIMFADEVIKALMKVVLPYFIVAFLDFKVVFRIKRLKAQPGRVNGSGRFARNSILIDLVYLVFNLLPTIFSLYFIIVISFQNSGLLVPSFFGFISNVLVVFPYIYMSFIFLLFVATNRIFRNELFLMVLHLKNKAFTLWDFYKTEFFKVS